MKNVEIYSGFCLCIFHCEYKSVDIFSICSEIHWCELFLEMIWKALKIPSMLFVNSFCEKWQHPGYEQPRKVEHPTLKLSEVPSFIVNVITSASSQIT